MEGLQQSPEEVQAEEEFTNRGKFSTEIGGDRWIQVLTQGNGIERLSILM
jgi:hypothetical protein